MAWRILEYEEIDSTNLEARRLVKAGEIRGGVAVWAHNQTRGRGRRGKPWWSAPGKSLTASLVFEEIESALATRLVSVSAVDAIRAAGGRGPLIKWPNDLVYGGRKVAGVLAESFRGPDGHFTVVGIGVNVGFSHAELDIPSRLPATSLLVEEERQFDIPGLLENLLASLDTRKATDASLLMKEYRELLAWTGETVSVSLPPTGRLVSGTLTGVDDSGALLLKVDETIMQIEACELLT
ncbi:MAG: biotin--[acetyl-CoA-carboxylase] ligase [Candidatus Anoxymicrobium japonicum]|uniref:Biotin--[acetyl-CoA-carboxylase] ligase n=1 Tax=Candidatus Anoxymicrobium japonicum TaxID=2013648 RepID=A0A2N3G576_9ACTN|nr:MAG: biotin--[acetyl-CoA-carboxylase] ligase [Candidatus Anoxymicrobium japonicum]